MEVDHGKIKFVLSRVADRECSAARPDRFELAVGRGDPCPVSCNAEQAVDYVLDGTSSFGSSRADHHGLAHDRGDWRGRDSAELPGAETAARDGGDGSCGRS